MSEHYLGSVARVDLKAVAPADGAAATAERDLTTVAGAAIGGWEVQPGELAGPAGEEAFVAAVRVGDAHVPGDRRGGHHRAR
jgi:hypothetical protein